MRRTLFRQVMTGLVCNLRDGDAIPDPDQALRRSPRRSQDSQLFQPPAWAEQAEPFRKRPKRRGVFFPANRKSGRTCRSSPEIAERGTNPPPSPRRVSQRRSNLKRGECFVFFPFRRIPKGYAPFASPIGTIRDIPKGGQEPPSAFSDCPRLVWEKKKARMLCLHREMASVHQQRRI